MSLRKYKKHVRLERVARLKQDDINQADEENLRLHMVMNMPTQSFRVGKPPSKEMMVERGKRLVGEHISAGNNQHQKAYMTTIFKGHETPGGPVVEKTRAEWLELLRSGMGIATYGDIRAKGPAIAIDGQLRAATSEKLVDTYDLLTEISKSVVCHGDHKGSTPEVEA